NLYDIIQQGSKAPRARRATTVAGGTRHRPATKLPWIGVAALLLLERAAQALAAVGQVQAHRGARRIRITTLDREKDIRVLLLQPLQVIELAPAVAAEEVEPLARQHPRRQFLQQLREVGIAGGACDRQVECDVARR